MVIIIAVGAMEVEVEEMRGTKGGGSSDVGNGGDVIAGVGRDGDDDGEGGGVGGWGTTLRKW